MGLIVVVVVLVGALVWVVLADGYLDSLAGKAFAERCALADTRELLGRIDLEDVAKDRGEDGRLADVDRAVARLARSTDIDKGEAQPGACKLASVSRHQTRGDGNVPKAALGTDAKVLQNKPDADLVLGILEAESTGSQTPDEVPGKHARRRVAADGHALGHAAKLGVIDPRRAVRRGDELCQALHVGLGIVLVWRLVAGPIGRHKAGLRRGQQESCRARCGCECLP